MTRARAREALKQSRRGDGWGVHYAAKGIPLLVRGMPHRDVEAAMRLLIDDEQLVASLRRLPEEYLPIARKLLRAHPQSLDATLLDAWGADDVRGCGLWLYTLGRTQKKRLPRLVVGRAVEAAQAGVAKFGARMPRLLGVLAADGSESSADIVLPLVHEALRNRSPQLDVLIEWVVPFARGSHFVRIVEALRDAREDRSRRNHLRDWLDALAIKEKRVFLEANVGDGDAWVLWFRLDTERLPHFEFTLSQFDGDKYFGVTDFKTQASEGGIDERPPHSLAAFPSWLARVKRAHRMNTKKWMLGWVKSSLRGTSRQRLLDRLLEP
ncbi:MAG: hypothetical protein QM817_17065 [Archangium sp.]